HSGCQPAPGVTETAQPWSAAAWIEVVPARKASSKSIPFGPGAGSGPAGAILSRLLAVSCVDGPTSNPSPEGNFRRADEGLLPSWEGSGVGRLMGRELDAV